MAVPACHSMAPLAEGPTAQTTPSMMMPLDEDDVFSILGESAANPASGGMPPVQSTAGDGDDLPPLPVAGFGNVAFPAYARHQLQHPPPPQLANSPWESGAIDGDAIKSMQAVQAAQQTVAARARAMHCRVDGGVGSTAGMAACGGSGSGGAVLTKQGWTPEEDETIVRMVQLTGQKWSFIACALPGRTDDAVRNRYLRLQKKMHAAAACSNKPAVTSEDLAEVQATKKGDMWTVEEDARIIEGVQHHGFKWQQIAAMLPGRSANAVRNRYLRCSPQSTQFGGGSPSAPPAGSCCTSSKALSGGAEGPKDHALRAAHEQPVAQPMCSAGDELVGTEMAGGSAQGLGHLFWDPAALYGEALESIRDDLFSHDGLRERTPYM